jgi:hypothetical protein
MKLIPTDEKIQIQWFAVDANGNKFRNNRGFISSGWDAVCSCGWETRTGGAIKASVMRDVEFHKITEHGYSYKFNSTKEEVK